MDVKFENQGTQLTGIFRSPDARPAGDGPYPAVAFVDGSGPAERDGWDARPGAIAAAGFASGWDKLALAARRRLARTAPPGPGRQALAAVACLAPRRTSTRPVVLLAAARWLGAPCRPMSTTVRECQPVGARGPRTGRRHTGRGNAQARRRRRGAIAERWTSSTPGPAARGATGKGLPSSSPPGRPLVPRPGRRLVEHMGSWPHYDYDTAPALERVTCPRGHLGQRDTKSRAATPSGSRALGGPATADPHRGGPGADTDCACRHRRRRARTRSRPDGQIVPGCAGPAPAIRSALSSPPRWPRTGMAAAARRTVPRGPPTRRPRPRQPPSTAGDHTAAPHPGPDNAVPGGPAVHVHSGRSPPPPQSARARRWPHRSAGGRLGSTPPHGRARLQRATASCPQPPWTTTGRPDRSASQRSHPGSAGVELAPGGT